MSANPSAWLSGSKKNAGVAPIPMPKSFDSHGLGEIARLVDVGSQDERGVVH
jgi:hypothetical protein